MKRLVTGFVLTALIVPGQSFGAWFLNGTILTNVAQTQYVQEMIPDGASGGIVVWADGRSITSFDIYAQRVNANGVALWTPNGVPICTQADFQSWPVITSDGAGGAIMAWPDYRPGTGGVYVRRINAAGAVQWTVDGVGLATNGAGVADALQIVPDGAGGAIVVWVDGRNGPSNHDIYARRVNSAGVAQWAANGVAICAAAGDQGVPDIVSDLAGGAIITWGDNRASPSNSDIYAQRVNGAGAVQWAANGVPVCTASGFQINPRTAPDGSGGVILGWWDSRYGSGTDIFAQRLNGSGVPQWQSDGVLISDAASEQQVPILASDGAGGAIIAWQDFRSGPKLDIYAQRINATGGTLWANNGVLVCGAFDNQFIDTVVPDGNGGAVLTWDDGRVGGTDVTDAYAQRLDAYGAAQWAAGGVAVSVGPGYQSDIKIAVDGTGGIIFAWDDARAGWDKIYAQRFESTYGYWGHPEPTITAVADIPHDQGGKVAINWTASSRDLPTPQTISFYSIWRAVSAVPVGSASIGLNDLRDLGAAFTEPVYLSTPGHYYEQVGTQAAHAWPGYSFSASTRADSVSGASGNEFFMIAAHDQYNNFIAFPSNEVSGHSVDNLAPLAPLSLVAQRIGNYVYLRWNRVHVPDLKDYSIYRKTSSGVTPVPMNFLSNANDTVLTDETPPASALYYIVTAYDVHANQSAPSNEASVQALTGIGNTPPITALTVLQNQPNPFAGTTDLRVGLPASSDLSIEVFDVAGRRVHAETLARQNAGWRSIPFDGRDNSGHALASGVYFYRVSASGKTVTNKMVIAR